MKRLSVIRVRLWVAAALPAVLVIVLLLVGFHQRQNEALRNAMRGQAQAAASQLASAAEFMLFAHNDDGLAHLVEAAKSGSSQIRGAAVHDANGNRVTGLHTTVTPASGYNSSTRSTYDSVCSEHNPN